MSPTPIALTSGFDALGFLPDRSPDDKRRSAVDGGPPWVNTVANYRDGGIFIVHYAGDSAWERHPDDEVVMVVDGETTMTMIIDGDRRTLTMGAMELIVVPANTWHRFHTPEGVKVMTITPQPTEHQLEDPDTLG